MRPNPRNLKLPPRPPWLAMPATEIPPAEIAEVEATPTNESAEVETITAESSAADDAQNAATPTETAPTEIEAKADREQQKRG